LLLLSTCSRASLKTDAFVCSHSTLTWFSSGQKNLMSLTTLDSMTALTVVDLQEGIVNSPFIHPIAVIERTSALLEAFRERDLPVVLVNVAGGARGGTEQPRRFSTLPEGFSDLIPELDRQAGDIAVTKRTWGAFANTDLEVQLKARGVTQVVLTGVTTGTGVEATARQAYEQEINVTLALDAMTDACPEAHEHSVASVFPRLGETGSTQNTLNLLATRRAYP
jgi:nicotinamidase-related amidase